MLLGWPLSAQSQNSVTPYIADASTVLLDHFDGSTSASVLAYTQNGAACGGVRPSATPVSSYLTGTIGLSQALRLSPPAGQPASSATYLQYAGGQLLTQSNGTLEFWIYLQSYGNGATLVSQGPYNGACAGWTFSMGVSSIGQLQAGAWAAFSMNSDAATVPLNTWTHVAATWGGTGAKLYINGTQVGSDANTGMPASGYGGSVRVFAGVDATSGPTNSIDELRISNVQRTTFSVGGGSTTSTWTTKAPMSIPRHGTSVSTYGGLVYVVGGYTGYHLSTLEVYNPATNTWTTKAPRPAIGSSKAIGVINGVLYEAGGVDCCVAVNTAFAYDIAGNSWTSKPAMPTTRQRPVGGVINGKFYVAGGLNGSTGLNTLEVYDSSTNAWAALAGMPTARFGAGGAVINGLFYVVGGAIAGASETNVLEVYNPATNSWTTKASMPTARADLATEVVNGVLYVMGGLVGSTQLTTVEAYDPASNTWSSHPSMLTARADARAAAVGGTIYVIGGYNSSGELSSVEAYTPAAQTVSLSSLSISCPSSLNEGTTASSACTATATYSNGTTALVTPTWSSANASVATISAGTITAGAVSANTSVAISASYSEGGGTKTASANVTVNDLPAAPTSVGAVAGNGSVTVTFTEQTRSAFPTPRYTFTVTCASTNGGTTGSASALGYDFDAPPSPGIAIGQSSITVSGLTNGSTYTCAVYGTNAAGAGAVSAASNSVTPAGVTTPTLSSLAVSCPLSLNEGTSESSACSATASYSNGTTVPVTPSWSSSNTGIATIASSGTITAGLVSVNTGITITGSYSSGEVTRTGNASVTVIDVAVQVTLVSLAISGGASELTSGASFNLTGTANFSDNSSRAVIPSWTSNSAAASVNSTGTVTGGTVSVDTPVTITATYAEGGVTKQATYQFAVKAPPLSALYVTASSNQLNVGATLALTATASYGSGITRTVNPFWSSNSAAATVDSFGVVTGNTVSADTSVTITATYTEGGVSRVATYPITVKVPGPTLTSLAVTGGSSELSTAATLSLTATARYSDNTSKTVAPQWSSNSAAATVSSTGTVTGNTVSVDTQVSITASYTENGVTRTASFNLTVKSAAPVLASLAISGGASQLSPGSTLTLTATATYTSGAGSSSKAVTPLWSSNSAAASVSTSGTVTGNAVTADTQVTITASYTEGGVSKTASYNLTVKAPSVQLTTLSISGNTSVLASGASMTLTANAGFSDNTTRAVTASWSANTTAVSVSSSGQVIAAQVTANTPVTVTATYTDGGITRTASVNLTVTASTTARLVSISISGSTSVPEGGTTTLKVIAAYSDGSNKTVAANWSSSNPSLVSVASTGALTVGQVAADTAVTLTASFTESGTTVRTTSVLTVRDVATALSFITIAGASSVSEGQATTLTATAHYTNGSSKTVTPTWTSSNSAVASVSASGVVTAAQVAASTTVIITATYTEGGVSKSDSSIITVKDYAPVVIKTDPSMGIGLGHSVALRNDGSVWSWGWSVFGQSGTGELKTRSTPIRISGIDSVISLGIGPWHNLVLRSDFTVWAWGRNGRGALGDGTTIDQLTPVPVTGLTGVKMLAAGLNHSLALKTDGTVMAWGSNSAGQLGDGTNVDLRLSPVPVPDLAGVVAIAANQNRSVALKSDGTVWGWGDLGSGAFYSPVPVAQLRGAKSLAAGWTHTLALKQDGTVWAWGDNDQGQLGDGTRNSRGIPVQVSGITDVIGIAAGVGHSVAVRKDGSVWTWGANSQGQQGSANTNVQATPHAVPNFDGGVSVAAGFNYTIVLKNDGSVWSAGDNLFGQLGDGSFIGNTRFSPVQDADQAKLFDLAPDQAKATVPADQVPVFYMKSEKAGDEVLSALGSVSSMSLASKIPTKGNGFSATYQMFVAVSVPGGKPALTPGGTRGDAVRSDTLFFKIEQTGWQPYGGGVVPAYLNDVSVSGVGEIALKILESTDLTGMSGAQFLVGFGTSAEEMLGAGRYRVMYRVP